MKVYHFFGDSIILFILQEGNTLHELQIDHMLDENKINLNSNIIRHNTVVLFHKDQFQLYSNIFTNTSMEIDYMANIFVGRGSEFSNYKTEL